MVAGSITAPSQLRALIMIIAAASAGTALFDWARSHGAVVSNSLRITESHPRGLEVSRPVEAGEPLVVLPPHLQLGLQELGGSAELEIMAAKCNEPALWSMQLGVALCAARRQGSDSRWHAYTEQLPQKLSSALAPWSGDSAALTAWPPTAQRVAGMRATLRRLHAASAPAALELDELCWATAIAASRAYRVRPGVGADAARLLPVIDLANYDTTKRATAEVGNAPAGHAPQSVALLATADLAAGTAVTVDYGRGRPLDNERLLLEYGFTLPALEHDTLRLPLGAISAGLAHVAGTSGTSDGESDGESDGGGGGSGGDGDGDAEGTLSEEEMAELGALQAAALGRLGDVEEHGLRFLGGGAPDERTRAVARALCARKPAELAEATTAATPPPAALEDRATAVLRAVAACALSEMGEAGGVGEDEGEEEGGFEAAARGYCEERRAILRRAAVL